MANAGRILILAKGAWESLTNYVQLDLVTRNGIAYIARRASVGVDPALDVSYTNWMPFGSAAEIATTASPGLVMPDGTSITVSSTGLISAVLGINDLTDVDIENPLTNQVLRYNGTSWTAITLGAAADKSTTNAVTEDSTALVESGAVYEHTHVLEENDDAMLNVLGAKNLLPNNATTQIISGVTFTVNSDGSVTIDTNGHTVDQNVSLFIVGTSLGYATGEDILESGKNYIISKGTSDEGAFVTLNGFNSSNVQTVYASADGGFENFTMPSSTKTCVRVGIASGHSASNLRVYPMIRPASVADDTYVPYAMTNRELTDASSVSLGYGIFLRKLGRMRIIDTSNSSASFPSAGISLGESVRNPAFGVCIYTKGSLQTGLLYVSTDNKLHLLTNVGANTDGTYVNGQVIYCV